MKLITFLIIVVFVQISIKGYSQITLNKKNALFEDVLQSIEKQTGYVFLYTDNDLIKTRVTIQVNNAPIEVTLKECLKNLPYTYKIVENNILLKKEEIPLNSAFDNFNLPLNIRGTVTDRNGIALPGATILVEGANRGVISDINGQYSVTINNRDAALVVSFLGYKTETVKIQGRTEINIMMAEQSENLGEIVVAVGYGTQKMSNVVGAISNINIRELKRAAPSNLTNAIGGRIPGLITRTMDGAVGGTQNRFSNGDLDDAQFFIRGKGTFNSQDPLVLVDGVEGSFSRINPEDVEQFSILKDASATAVYGARGANGVILITTRSGKMGLPQINVTSQVRMLKPLDFPRFLGSFDYATLYNEALRNADPNATPKYTDADLEHYRTGDSPYTHPNVNWRDLLLRDHSNEQQHIANISGGTEKVRYYVSGEFNHADGLFVSSKEHNTNYDYRRFNLRTNLDFTISKSTQLDVKLNGRLNDLNFSAKGESSGQRVNAVAWGDIVNRLPNTSQLYNPNGTYAYGTGVLGWNSLADLYEGGYYRRLSNTLETNLGLTQKLDFVTPGLVFGAKYAMTFGTGSTKYLYEQPAIWKYDPGTQEYTLWRAKTIPAKFLVNPFQDFLQRRYMEGSLNYAKTFSNDHKVTAMGVYIETTTQYQINIPEAFRGISGRLTYSFKDKYLIEGNAGYNGSDRFMKGKRYGFFPAGAVGWIVSEEKFMKEHVKFIDFLKFRGSYGTVGNDKIAGYSYYYQYVFNDSAVNPNPFSLGLSPVQTVGLTEGTVGNEDVSWEVARKADLGMELHLFKSRVTFTGDLFHENRNNILTRRNDAPIYTGLVASKLPPFNIGEVTNRGYELELSYRDKVGDVGFTIGGNYTFVRNTVDYYAETPKKYDYQAYAGNAMGTPYGYVWTGKFYDTPDISNPAIPRPVSTIYPGDLMFKDLNEDGVINSDDMTYFGYPEVPEKMFGLNLDVGYKNFYVSTFWQGASNINFRPSGPLSYEFGPNIQPFHKEGRWVYDPARGLDTRATATYPSLIVGGSSQTKLPSTFNYLNAEYVRLRTAEIGYVFPESITKKLRVANLKVFINGFNLLTFDHLGKYNLDPEYFGSLGSSNGVNTGAYSPQNKFYAAGLNVTF